MLKGLAQRQRDFSPSMPIAIEPGHWRENYFSKSPESRFSQQFLFLPGVPGRGSDSRHGGCHSL